MGYNGHDTTHPHECGMPSCHEGLSLKAFHDKFPIFLLMSLLILCAQIVVVH